MKNKFAYVLFLLVAALSATHTYALTERIVLRKQVLHYTASSTSFSSHASEVVGKTIRCNSGTHNRSEPGSESGPQIRQTPDATTNASVVPAAQSLLALLAVLHLFVDGDNLPVGGSPFSRSLHHILFQVIISPNAP